MILYLYSLDKTSWFLLLYDLTPVASLVKKVIRGNAYYYVRECKRVNGKPKIVSQQYLGRVDDIARKLRDASPKQPESAVVRDFGACAALFDVASRLRLVEHVDRHAPKRGSGPSVGTCLLAAILNRCLAPCSKASLARWFDTTVLPRLLPVRSSQLASQRFRDHMDRLSPAAIQAIERDIVACMTSVFDIDLRQVLFDATNFFTYIGSFNQRSKLARRGHGKEGRKSLRIVGLALLVSADFRLPLLHRTYPGNRPDAPTFGSLASRLAERCREIAGAAEHVTLVFDKGSNSQENLEAVRDAAFHFIGSLVPTQHADLLAVPAARLRPLDEDGLPGVQAWRTRRTVFGVERTVLVTWNRALFDAREKTLLREIDKRRRKLRELQLRLRRRRSGKIRGGRKPTLASTRKKIDGWLSARHMRELFAIELEEEAGLPRLRFRFRHSAWERLRRTLPGKTLLFTDNDGWSDAELVRGYRAQHHVESAFRQIKDSGCIAIRPQYHWTDGKIEVHVFCCVLALLLCALLQRELSAGGEPRSIPALLEELGGIREVDVLYPASKPGGKPAIRTTLSQMSARQRTLYDALNLGKHTI